ncbi:DUF4935 domain-containing protein [Pseudoxanthomonas mexicana]|uniref:DUF4935 domain-containing protein n=1 Tax=Pseudoxanthomonas mexicana TaxID=128785 RepID=A0A7G9T9P6_PSEMX|nr:PIN domain-containing protein [Pseudoxanthomonas mexicana]QNN76821.1 DUF4935 domain-containing protein [Pseudoxanthomonas mexicana]
MPLKVILDTNVYTSDRFRQGQGFKTLSTLCTNGHTEVLLPHIVKREFETQLDANAAKVIAEFEKASKQLARGPIPKDLRAELDTLREKFKTRKPEVIGSHAASFAEWQQAHGVSELALNGDHAVAAMLNYFTGGPPFKSAKKRDDIPDALLYQQVVDLAQQGPIVFVCKDATLSASVGGIANITHYADLNSFVASPQIQAVIAQQEAAENATKLLQRLKAFAADLPNALTEYVSDHGAEDLASTHFSSPSIPGDDREAYIYMFGSLYDIEFDWDSASYHGDMVFVVPFSGEGEFNITYYVPKWDVEEIDNRGGSYSYHNDYVVEADEEAALWVNGRLRIKLADDYQPGDELEDAIEELTIDEVDPPVLVEDKN